jgi:CubicO group peptidase (beta-lactamase class C family)
MVIMRYAWCALALLSAATLQPPPLAGLPSPQAFDWQTATPESQAMSAEALDTLRNRLATASKALLVIRNDRVVYEWYADGHSAAAKHYTASMAKAIVGGVSLGVALTDSRIALDDPVGRYVPQWKSDPRKSRITIRQLGSHTSGLEDAEADGLPHDKLTGWKGDFWKRLAPPDDPFTIARDRTPAIFDPGEKFQYSNPGIAMLTYALTASLVDGSRKIVTDETAGRPRGSNNDVRTLLRDRVMRPVGVADEEWSIGYGATSTVNGLPLVAAWGGGGYTARAVARIGRLMLRQGDWNGAQLLSKEAVRQITSDAGTPGHGGMGWWSNSSGKYPKLPKDAYWGSGAGHQVVLVIPSLKLIAVRNGASLGQAMEHHDVLNDALFAPLVGAIADARATGRADGAPPYPPSPVIRELVWAPAETIRRDAQGSDNWPLTWGDDDALYGAFGDGNGFAPRTPEKLSMGFARITGGPQDFRGANIRSSTGETRGDGAKGKKSSGLLMVDGILYLWARNAASSQLAWSSDRGRTWSWSDWRFTAGFGAPTFLNFGRNYAGARDQFVYVYSHDSDSAYTPADRMVLARVPANRIRERSAYEFFKRLDGAQQPIWTKAIDERGAVFVHAGHCYRSGISYNAGLRRYLWSQTLPGGDARFEGGFGIYDAPEPWGPWTTAYYTERWDVGPGETSSMPTKWMSADGATVHLVFSGDDAFSVRRATIRQRQLRPRQRQPINTGNSVYGAVVDRAARADRLLEGVISCTAQTIHSIGPACSAALAYRSSPHGRC